MKYLLLKKNKDGTWTGRTEEAALDDKLRDFHMMDDMDLVLVPETGAIIKNRTGPVIEARSDIWLKWYSQIVDDLLNHCNQDPGHGECTRCSEIVCPSQDPMHLHHDGCPSCCSMDHGQQLQEITRRTRG